MERGRLRTRLRELLFPNEPQWALDWCFFRIRFGHASGYLSLQVFPFVEQAHEAFARNGNKFTLPRLSGRRIDEPEGNQPIPPFDPPIQSDLTVPALADENRLWRGYGGNSRGVIKFRIGSVMAEVNGPSVEESERVARTVASQLTAIGVAGPVPAWTERMRAYWAKRKAGKKK